MLRRVALQSAQLAVRSCRIAKQARTLRAGRAAFGRLQGALNTKAQALRVSLSYVTGKPDRDEGCHHAQELTLLLP